MNHAPEVRAEAAFTLAALRGEIAAPPELFANITGERALESLSQILSGSQYQVSGRANAWDAEELRRISQEAARYGIMVSVGEQQGEFVSFSITNNAYIPANMNEEERAFLSDCARASVDFLEAGDVDRAIRINTVVVTFIEARRELEALESLNFDVVSHPGWLPEEAMRLFRDAEGNFDPALFQRITHASFEDYQARGFAAIQDSVKEAIRSSFEEAIPLLRTSLESLVSGGEGRMQWEDALGHMENSDCMLSVLNVMKVYSEYISGVRGAQARLGQEGFQEASEDSKVRLIQERDDIARLQGGAEWELTYAFFMRLGGDEGLAEAAERRAGSYLEDAGTRIAALSEDYTRTVQYERAAASLESQGFQGVSGRMALEFLEGRRDAIVLDLREAAREGRVAENVEQRLTLLDGQYQRAAYFESLVDNLERVAGSDSIQVGRTLQSNCSRFLGIIDDPQMAELMRANGIDVQEERGMIAGERDRIAMDLNSAQSGMHTECSGLRDSYSPETLSVANPGAQDLAEMFDIYNSPLFARAMDHRESIILSAGQADALAAYVERDLRSSIPPNISILPGVQAGEELAIRINTGTVIAALSTAPAWPHGFFTIGMGAFYGAQSFAASGLVDLLNIGFTGWGAYELSEGTYRYISAETDAQREGALDSLRNGALMLGMSGTLRLPRFLEGIGEALTFVTQTSALGAGAFVYSQDVERWAEQGHIDYGQLATDLMAMAFPAYGLMKTLSRGGWTLLGSGEAATRSLALPEWASVSGAFRLEAELAGTGMRVPVAGVVAREAGAEAVVGLGSAGGRAVEAGLVGERIPMTALEEQFADDAMALELIDRARVHPEWVTSGEEFAGSILDNGQVFRTIEDIAEFRLARGESLDMLEIISDKKALTDIRNMFGDEAADAVARMYLDIWQRAAERLAGRGGETMAFLVRNGRLSDETYITILGEGLTGRTGEVQAALREAQQWAFSRLNQYGIEGTGATLADLHRLILSRRGSPPIITSVSFGVVAERLTQETVPGSVMRLAMLADDMEVGYAAAMRGAAGLGAPLAGVRASPLIRTLSPDMQVGGMAVEVGVSRSPVVTSNMGWAMGAYEGAVEEASMEYITSQILRKGYAQVVGNAMRYGGMNALFGHGGTNVILQAVEDGVAAFAETSGLTVYRAGAMRYIIEGGTAADAQALREAVSASLMEAGLDMSATARVAGVSGEAAQNVGALLWDVAPREWANGNTLISFMSTGSRDPAIVTQVLGRESEIAEIIEIVRGDRSIRGMDDFLTYLERNGLFELEARFMQYIERGGDAAVGRLRGLAYGQ